MSNIKVESINQPNNNEEVKEVIKDDTINEEVKEEIKPEVVEEVKEEVKEPVNEVVEETKEVVKKPRKPRAKKVKEVPKVFDLKQEPTETIRGRDRVICPRCSKNLSYRSYRYSHDNICRNRPEVKPIVPVKPQAKPKPKSLPKSNLTEPKPNPPVPKQQPIINNIAQEAPKQLSPYDIAKNSYIYMKEQMKAQRIEKINNFKSKMF